MVNSSRVVKTGNFGFGGILEERMMWKIAYMSPKSVSVNLELNDDGILGDIWTFGVCNFALYLGKFSFGD
ncbi:hypothetical protein Dsin_032998 [Dipteronia sinensis]|uniref:Protein kinase domain-containing protein n=1 Tax=Dipteronia sinensis TaxID=43782 RepID=A0AAD9Z0P3_9ROSI|nr:hypothetical protein Dsin_032998 [Dipteronia sinensis]